MHKIIDIYQKIHFQIFCLAVFILRLPPLYILPIRSALFNSHSIARYLLLVLFMFSMVLIYLRKIRLTPDKKLLALVLFYFFTQSISIIPAVNIVVFLAIYKHLVFGILIFFLSIIILDSENKIKKLINVLLISVVINILYEFFIYFQPNVILSFLKNFSYGQYWDVLFMNYQRQRFFIDVYDSALIPFLLYYLYTSKKKFKKVITLVIIGLVSLFALISNFRTQLIMVMFSLVFGSFIYFRKFLIHGLQIFTLLLFLYLGYQASLSYVGYNSLDRLITPGEEEYATITKRTFFWKKSVEMGLSSPLFGIGLNNYYDYLPASLKFNLSSFQWVNDLQQISETHPHDIFFAALAETGFMGLLSLILLTIYFIKTDLKYLKKHHAVTSSAIVGFWSLFIYAIFNPPVTLPYISLFWILRGMIANSGRFIHLRRRPRT